MPDDGTRSMTIRLDEGRAQELEAIARVDSRSIAEVINEATCELIFEYSRDEDFQTRLGAYAAKQDQVLARLTPRDA